MLRLKELLSALRSIRVSRKAPDPGCASALPRIPGLRAESALVVVGGGDKHLIAPHSRAVEIQDGKWLVGRFFHDAMDGFAVSLGMESQLHDSDGRFIARGWNGDEHNVAVIYYGLRPGMTIRYHQVFDHKPSAYGEYAIGSSEVLAS